AWIWQAHTDPRTELHYQNGTIQHKNGSIQIGDHMINYYNGRPISVPILELRGQGEDYEGKIFDIHDWGMYRPAPNDPNAVIWYESQGARRNGWNEHHYADGTVKLQNGTVRYPNGTTIHTNISLTSMGDRRIKRHTESFFSYEYEKYGYYVYVQVENDSVVWVQNSDETPSFINTYSTKVSQYELDPTLCLKFSAQLWLDFTQVTRNVVKVDIMDNLAQITLSYDPKEQVRKIYIPSVYINSTDHCNHQEFFKTARRQPLNWQWIQPSTNTKLVGKFMHEITNRSNIYVIQDEGIQEIMDNKLCSQIYITWSKHDLYIAWMSQFTDAFVNHNFKWMFQLLHIHKTLHFPTNKFYVLNTQQIVEISLNPIRFTPSDKENLPHSWLGAYSTTEQFFYDNVQIHTYTPDMD